MEFRLRRYGVIVTCTGQVDARENARVIVWGGGRT
jgi:hypothetical protein